MEAGPVLESRSYCLAMDGLDDIEVQRLLKVRPSPGLRPPSPGGRG